MTNTAVNSLEVRDFCPQEEYLLSQTDSNITMRQVNVSTFNSFTFPEFATPQGVVYGMCVLFFCPSNHTIHVFLLCDPESHCRTQQIPTRFFTFFNTTSQQSARMVNSAGVTSLSYPMFPCEDGITTVQHSMVCDFRQDCPDNSDESFCEHPSRTGFLCSNGQYALRGQRCNEHSDCADDSDEKNCDDNYGALCQFCSEFTYEAVNQIWYINLDGSGSFTWQLMLADQPCPDSHYQCTAELLDCLPIYTRCNGTGWVKRRTEMMKIGAMEGCHRKQSQCYKGCMEMAKVVMVWTQSGSAVAEDRMKME
ncbi:hypothetical protein ACOMHN_007552 [Nucella lapillus]